MNNRLNYIVVVVLVLITGAISVLCYFQNQDLSIRLNRIEFNQQKIQQTISISNNHIDIDTDKGYTIGNISAPVTLTIFVDYECGYCKYFFSEIYPKLFTDYISKGLVRFVVMDFPLTRHQFAIPIAKYARCAQKNGTYDEFINKVFDNIELMDMPTLEKFALEAGINCDECNSDLAINDIIFENIKIGRSAGVTGTPTSVINNQLFVGVKPYEELQSMINHFLNNTSGACN